MSKAKPDEREPDMQDHYDFSGGVRGKYADRFSEGSTMVVLEPDVAAVFSDATSVNEALRELIQQGTKRAHR